MGVEIKVNKAGSQYPIVEDTFSTVAERQDFKAITTGTDGLAKGVHLFVVNAMTEMVFYPSVQDACSVYAQKNAGTGLRRGVIHMGEGVHPRRVIVNQLVAYRINDAGCTGGCSYFTRLQYVQRKGVIRLIAGFVGYRNASFKAQLRGRFRP